MSILDTIRSSLRSLLGGGEQSESTSSRTEGQVSVEHEPSEDREAADASTESAIKGTDESTETEAEAEPAEDAVAADTDAAASTGSLVDEEAGKEPAEVVSEPGTEAEEAVDADEPSADDTATTDEEEQTEAAAADEVTDDAGDERMDDAGDEGATDADSEPVETLKGIGPAYGDRLGDAGIETVADLAGADAADLAAEIDVSEKRVTGWIERAQEES